MSIFLRGKFLGKTNHAMVQVWQNVLCHNSNSITTARTSESTSLVQLQGKRLVLIIRSAGSFIANRSELASEPRRICLYLPKMYLGTGKMARHNKIYRLLQILLQVTSDFLDLPDELCKHKYKKHHSSCLPSILNMATGYQRQNLPRICGKEAMTSSFKTKDSRWRYLTK